MQRQMQRTQSKIIRKCHRHWASYWPHVLLFIYFISLASESLVLALVLAAAVVALFFWDYECNWVAMTDTKVMVHKGIIKSKTQSIPLSKIQEVTVSNGLIGKIFGYHTITVEHGGGKGTVCTRMAKAVDFADAVNDRIDRLAYTTIPHVAPADAPYSYVVQQKSQDEPEL